LLSVCFKRSLVQANAREAKRTQEQHAKARAAHKALQTRAKTLFSLCFAVVPMEGVEPTHSHEYKILSLARLPIPPHRLSCGWKYKSISADVKNAFTLTPKLSLRKVIDALLPGRFLKYE
jgi:hypothetical protein